MMTHNSLDMSCYRRFGAIPRFTDMKVFPHGITHLSQMNAFEYRDIMKMCVVCFKGAVICPFLYVTKRHMTKFHLTGIFEDLDPIAERAVMRLLTTCLGWYMLLRRNKHDENSRAELATQGRLVILGLKAFHCITGPLSEV